MRQSGLPALKSLSWCLAVAASILTSLPAQAVTWGGNRSGLPWISGASVGMEAIERIRGRALDARTAFFSIDTWDSLAASADAIPRFRAGGGQLILAVGMLPRSHRGQHAPCAAGAFDARIRTIGDKIVRAGGGDAILRLGWEANRVNGYPWAVTGDGSAYKACFRRWISILRAIPGQSFVIDWNMAQVGTFAYHVDRMYPGGDVVDIIGAQQYDRCPPVRNENEWSKRYWETRANGSPIGLGRWLEYARSKNKRLSIPEWGVGGPRNICGTPGFDNPFFIGKMYEFFKNNADSIAYEAYFNGDDGSGNDENGSHRLADNPASAARYGELWRSSVTPAPATISILEAYYYGMANYCDASTALKHACDGKTACTITAADALCGDPEPSVAKRLAVVYACRSQRKTDDQAQGSQLRLACD